MLLAAVVETSNRVAGTSKRLEKIELLAKLLRQLQPEEIEIVAAFLGGRTRQGRIGIGYGALRDSSAAAAETPSLEIVEVDRIFQSILATSGSGSQGQRLGLLRQMFSRATGEEQQFLTGLLGGELRQGALEAVMVEALAKTSGVPVDRVRRAVMLAGDIAVVARALADRGDVGLSEYDIQLFRPVQPMLAGTAADASLALADLGEAALEYKLDGARVQVHKSDDQVAVYSRSLNDVERCYGRCTGSGGIGSRSSREEFDPGWRGHQSADGWTPAAISSDDAQIRAQTGRRSHAQPVADDSILVRPAVPQWHESIG